MGVENPPAFAVGKPASATVFTQTYATAQQTVPAITAAALGAPSIVLLADVQTYLTSVQTTVNALRADALANRQLINGLVDELQAAGLVG